MPLVRKPAGTPQESAPAAEVLASLSSSSEEARWNAARAAAGIPGSATALGTALRDEPVPRIREALFTSLARLGTADSMAAAVSLLRSDDAGLRAGALDALRIMVRAAPVLLPALLDDSDVDVRILSCELARALPGEVATSLICELLRKDPPANVCAAAVDVLAEVGQPEALPVLAQCAARFRDVPFLTFAIQIATDRINAQPPSDGS